MTNDDRALSWFWGWLLAIAFVLAVAVGCGAPVINSNGLSWDNSAWINAQQQKTERERIQANRDIRIEQERGETVQAFVEVAGQALIIVAIVFGMAKALPPIVASLAAAFAAWAARPHRQAAPASITVNITYQQALDAARPHLLALPDAKLEWIDGAEIDGAWVEGWAVVDDEAAIVRPLQLTDSQHGRG